MPQLSDLRESGAIEQDADMVCFIYRPEYHDLNSNEMGESIKGETYLRIAKHRNGSLENIKFRAKLEIQKFFEEVENQSGIESKIRELKSVYDDLMQKIPGECKTMSMVVSGKNVLLN